MLTEFMEELCWRDWPPCGLWWRVRVRKVAHVSGPDRAVGCFVGAVRIVMLVAEVLAADFLERNAMPVVAVPRSHKDFRSFHFVQTTPDCGTPRKPCSRQSWRNSAARGTHTLPHEFRVCLSYKVADPRHACATKCGVELNDCPVPDLLVVV